MNARCPADDAKWKTRRAQPWLGTLVDIGAHAHSERALAEGINAAFAAIARVHRTLGGHDAMSELTRVNRRAVLTRQAISTDLRTVLACALALAACSDGAFDPTVGGELIALGLLPPLARHDRGATWRDVVLDEAGVAFKRPLVLDLNGIAKGYAVDCAIAALRDAGVTRACVNAGGDLRVFGSATETVHVRTGGAQSVMIPVIEIRDGAVASSAYGGQRRRIRGRMITPLIEPRAGLPSMTTRTVTVVAPTCMIADALTKVVALNGRRAESVMARYGAGAAILSPAKGRWRCTRLPRVGPHDA
ncbi:MAG TPA: FAD:protein FMN transferase [Casimicrobiaceae bacterium]|nr:FAD:protein FMN transferase [Casimicrobiaceae bacterium]